MSMRQKTEVISLHLKAAHVCFHALLYLYLYTHYVCSSVLEFRARTTLVQTRLFSGFYDLINENKV